MRVVGTVIACAALAFGAAFLIGRAVDHQGSNNHHAAAPARATTTADAQLASYFATQLPGVKLRQIKRVVHHHRAKVHRSSSSAASNAGTVPVTPANTAATQTPPPVYTPPARSTPSQPKSGTGSGTTSVGGSKKSGTGTTSVGG